MFKKILTYFIFAAVFLTLPGSVRAFGVTPGEISFSDLKPGSRFEKEIYVTRPPDEINEDMTVVLEPDLGDMESWFTFVPGKEFSFPAGSNTTTFRVIVNIPADIEIKNYKGQIVAKGLSDTQAAQGVTIIKGAILGVALETTDADVANLKVLSITAPEVNSGDPVSLLLNIQNLGNTSASPDEVILEILDLVENPLEKLVDNDLEAIDPFSTKEIRAVFNSDLDEGQYRIDATVMFAGEEIAKEKMILTVNAKPAQVDRDSDLVVDQRSLTSQTGMAVAILGMLFLALILAIYVRRSTISDSDIEQRIDKLIHENKILTWFLIAASMGLITVGFYFYLAASQQTKTTVPEQTEEVENVDVDEMLDVETSDDASPSSSDVQGVSIEIQDDKGPMKVERPGTEGLYPIFAAPSFGAEIIYEAEDGETFDANFLSDGWYRVVFEDGTIGWLHETSIKAGN